MQKYIRYGVGIPLAGVVTIGLTLFMAEMISTEFKAEEKLASLDFAINHVPDDVIVIPNTKRPKLIEVEVPPPPPTLLTDEAKAIVEPPIHLPGDSDVFKPTTVDILTVGMIPVDSNPQPILRLPPVMPARADRSGYCDVSLSVSAKGAPYEVQTTYCSDRVFERSTIKAVAKWKYRPRIKDGLFVSMTGVTNRVTYRLTDERGNVIPE